MRPVDKGASPRSYTRYADARHDLAARLGYYCSYCEMKLFNSIEIEHIVPQSKGGAVVDWDNFLLSCKYCNTIKSNQLTHIRDYFWPDRDNTDLAFAYDKAEAVVPAARLDDALKKKALSTISLTGLDKNPAGPSFSTEADTRWRSRKEAWDIAERCLVNWRRHPHPQMADVIASCSLGGHYSIWQTVFINEPLVLAEIDKRYREKNLYKIFLPDGSRAVRPGGLI